MVRAGVGVVGLAEFLSPSQPFVALDAAVPRLTGRLDSRRFGFTIVLDSRRRAAELNRWLARIHIMGVLAERTPRLKSRLLLRPSPATM